MRTGFFYILVFILFSDCTTKYSNPYSAGDVARNLSKKYATEIEVVDIKKNLSPDGVKYNEYVLRDKKRGFLFEAGSFVVMDSHVISYDRKQWDQYARDLMRNCQDEVMQVAARYEIRLVPPLRELPDILYRSRSTVRPFDSVFVSSPAQLERVVDLYTELANLYAFTYVRYHKNETKNPKLILCYLPGDEPDRSKNLKICHLLYLDYRVENGADNSVIPVIGDSLPKKVKYQNYIPAKYEIRRIIRQSWNKAVDDGRIAQEKIN
jgi:hypothetical protein